MPHLLQSRRRRAPRRQSRVRTHCRHGARSMAPGSARPRSPPGPPAPSRADRRQPQEKPQAEGRMRWAAAEALPSQRRRRAMFYA